MVGGVRPGSDRVQRPLRASAPCRAGRDGRCLPGPRRLAGPAGSGEGPVPGVRQRPELRRAVPPGGQGGGQPQPPQHRRHLRLGTGAGHLLHRHGVRRGPQHGRRPAVHRSPQPRPRRRDRVGRGRGPQQRPQRRAGTPRHQARQHHRQRRRSGEGGRLRHSHRTGAEGRRQPHPHRLGHGHGHLLLARTGPGQGPRRALRPLLAGDRALRDDRRQAPVHRRHLDRRGREARSGAAAPTVDAGCDHRAVAGGHHPQAAGQEPGQPLPKGRRPAGRPAALPRRRPPDPRERHPKSSGAHSRAPALGPAAENGQPGRYCARTGPVPHLAPAAPGPGSPVQPSTPRPPGGGPPPPGGGPPPSTCRRPTTTRRSTVPTAGSAPC